MTIWAISDLHLSCSVPDKDMKVFGPLWEGYMDKLSAAWKQVVAPEDLVVIAGDICWAMRLEEAVIDLAWIDALPGTKLLLKGNHDLWWSSLTKMEKMKPASIHFLQNSVFQWKDVSLGGARLWDTHEYSFHGYIHFQENPRAQPKEKKDPEEQEKIFVRELERLKLSLVQLDQKARLRIALTHYPPISADLQPSRASAILEQFNVDICVFGHLHNVKKREMFGEKKGIKYILTSADYLDFKPVKLVEG